MEIDIFGTEIKFEGTTDFMKNYHKVFYDRFLYINQVFTLGDLVYLRVNVEDFAKNHGLELGKLLSSLDKPNPNFEGQPYQGWSRLLFKNKEHGTPDFIFRVPNGDYYAIESQSDFPWQK